MVIIRYILLLQTSKFCKILQIEFYFDFLDVTLSQTLIPLKRHIKYFRDQIMVQRGQNHPEKYATNGPQRIKGVIDLCLHAYQ